MYFVRKMTRQITNKVLSIVERGFTHLENSTRRIVGAYGTAGRQYIAARLMQKNRLLNKTVTNPSSTIVILQTTSTV